MAKCIFYSMLSAFCSLSQQIVKIVSYAHIWIFDLSGICFCVWCKVVNQLYFFPFEYTIPRALLIEKSISFLLLCSITFVKIWIHISVDLFLILSIGLFVNITLS